MMVLCMTRKGILPSRICLGTASFGNLSFEIFTYKDFTFKNSTFENLSLKDQHSKNCFKKIKNLKHLKIDSPGNLPQGGPQTLRLKGPIKKNIKKK